MKENRFIFRLYYVFFFYFTGKNETKVVHSKKPVDCADLLEMGRNKSGVYEIWPMNRVMEGKSIFVYCDMDTSGGGWTVSASSVSKN